MSVYEKEQKRHKNWTTTTSIITTQKRKINGSKNTCRSKVLFFLFRSDRPTNAIYALKIQRQLQWGAACLKQVVSTYLLIYLFFHSFYESVDGIVYSNRSCVQQDIIFLSLLLFFFLQSFSSLFTLKLASFFRSSKVYSFKFNFSFEFLIFLIFLCRILWVSHSRHQITTTLKQIFFFCSRSNVEWQCWWKMLVMKMMMAIKTFCFNINIQTVLLINVLD